MNHRFYMKPWEEFLEDQKKITEILNLIEITKKIDLIENMQDYIFKSRKEDHKKLEEAIMGKRVLTAYERAFEDGEINKALETARRMKEEGFNLGQILKITGLSEDQLRENGILQECGV